MSKKSTNFTGRKGKVGFEAESVGSPALCGRFPLTASKRQGPLVSDFGGSQLISFALAHEDRRFRIFMLCGARTHPDGGTAGTLGLGDGITHRSKSVGSWGFGPATADRW